MKKGINLIGFFLVIFLLPLFPLLAQSIKINTVIHKDGSFDIIGTTVKITLLPCIQQPIVKSVKRKSCRKK